LLPQCLRDQEQCSAPIDEYGLLCKGCGSCPIHELTTEAEQLGYAVLVAEGSAVVLEMIERGQIEAVVGVSCMDVLEKCFPRMEARAVPGMAIPLLQNGCANTTVDLDWVWEAVHLTSQDRTHCLNLDAVKREVRSWFTEGSLRDIIGAPDGETDRIARNWLARDGKRWRPYLTVCAFLALRDNVPDKGAQIPDDLRKLAVAVECFHKASLVHDDIEDDDDERYGASTVHVQHGVPVALNVGDFLLGEGYRLIGELDADPQTKIDMLCMAADGHLTLSRGQGAELCWSRRPHVLSSLEVLDIFRQKTAPAFEVALRLGAFYANADKEVHNILRSYSESLGIAYQIRDDLEDFSGQGDSNDLCDMRPSVVLAIAHKRAATGTETELVAALWNHTCRYDEVAGDMFRIIRDRGVTVTATELLQAYTQQAIRSLRTLRNPTLKGLLRRVIVKIFGENLSEGYYGESTARNAPRGEARTEPSP
jgi:geranylgeranyl pyrophosphate synthase